MTSRTSRLGRLASAGLLLTAPMLMFAPAPATAAGDDVGANIIGGTDATEDYPFAARLLTVYPGLGTARCTATVVTDGGVTAIVGTAACVADLVTAEAMPATAITVQVGSTHLDQLTNITPTRVEVWQGFDWGTGVDQVGDLAVMALPDDVHLTGVPLGQLAADGRWVRLLGWGKDSIGATEPPAVLQQLDTRITDPGACVAAGITAGEICVAPATNGGQTCYGDGDALGRSPRGWVLLGGASRETSEDCTGPTVYTDFTYWSSWIRAAMHHRQPHHPRHVADGAANRYLSLTH